MRSKKVLINRETWDRFVLCVKAFFTSGRVGLKAKGLGALLIAFLFGINGLNVVNSYVGRDFMTAIKNRNQAEFTFQAFLYIGVFVASTLVAGIYRFSEERLGLTWREWATQKALIGYADRRVYYRLKLVFSRCPGTNPGQTCIPRGWRPA